MAGDDEGTPFAIYWSTLTPNARDTLIGGLPVGESDGSFFARVIVQMAENRDGSKMFKQGDEAILRNEFEFALLERIGKAMFAPATVEAAAGN